MATPLVRPLVKDWKASSGELDAAIARELAEIVEDVGLTSAEEEAEMEAWFCWMPSPGVRYFTYR